MEQIGRIYGKFILEGIAVVCLSGFLFNNFLDDAGNIGLLYAIGRYLPKVEEKYDSYTDFGEIYLEESHKSAPEIKYVAGAVDTGVVQLSQIIKAVDYSGSELAIEILSIKNMDDVEMIEVCNLETTQIVFERAGIYRVEVRAVDDGNRVTKCQIKIPVNRKIMMEDVY